jgi:indolepyruvate ferredoxin oxidoreductase
VNITYKILYNDAVAMTGGQPVDGSSRCRTSRQVAAEGAKKIVIVTDEPEKYNSAIKLPEGLTVHPPRRTRRHPARAARGAGCTILIYDQTCATEKRRRRKRGTFPDPASRAFINDAVRRLRRLLGQVELPVGRAAGDRTRHASARSTSRRATRTSRA